MTASPPNIILLSADALRADHLSYHGYPRQTSPVLDELATEALTFPNAYSASSHTREAVPALLTGEYPDSAVDADYHLARDTIASVLSERGFATGAFHSNPYVSRAYGFSRGFDTFDDDLHLGQHKLIALAQRALDKFRNRHYARAETINDRALEWVDSLEDNEPFLLWNHYMDTHGPYEPPAAYAMRFRDDRISDADAQSLYQRALSDPESITEAEREVLIDLYDGEIRYNDAKIGEFLAALRERELLDESLLIVTADHGDAFGEHGYYGHPRYLHDELTHVPLLVRPPGGRADHIKTPVSTLDIVATIKDAVGDETEFSLLDSSAADVDRVVFSQARGENEQSHIRRYAVRSANGVVFCERDNQTGRSEFTEVGDSDLRSRITTHIEERVAIENGTAEMTDDGDQMDEEIEQRLQALGYKE